MPHNLKWVKSKMSDELETLQPKPKKQTNTRRKAKDLTTLSKALKANLQRRKSVMKPTSDISHKK